MPAVAKGVQLGTCSSSRGAYTMAGWVKDIARALNSKSALRSLIEVIIVARACAGTNS